jgi:hypothetical protein
MMPLSNRGVPLAWPCDSDHVGYRESVRSRRSAASRLNTLACGQPIDFVVSTFGPPALRRTHDGGLTESVFATPHALVQVLADDAVGILRWSITVIDERFVYRARDLTFAQTDVRLGKSKFWNLTHDETGHVAVIDGGRLNYVEAHDFGAAGAHQTYLFAFNDAGVGEFDYVTLREAGLLRLMDGVFAEDSRELEPDAATALRSFRSATTINTLTVLGASAPPELLTLLPHGVDLDYVRLFRPSTARRRRANHKGGV